MVPVYIQYILSGTCEAVIQIWVLQVSGSGPWEMRQCSRQHSEDPSASPSLSALECLDHNSETLNSPVATEQA